MIYTTFKAILNRSLADSSAQLYMFLGSLRASNEWYHILATLHRWQRGGAAVGWGCTAARCQRDNLAPALCLVADCQSRQPHELAGKRLDHDDDFVNAADVVGIHTGQHTAVALELRHNLVVRAQWIIVVCLHLCRCFNFHTAKVD